jgi:DNA mismatch repair protein MutS2
MNEGTLRSLEFDRIVDAVRSFALTPLGATALAQLCPLTDSRGVRAALAATSEGVRYLEANAPFALQAPPDLEDALVALAVEGRPLEPEQLLGLADLLASVAIVRNAVSGAAGGPFPSLRALLDGCRPFDREVAEIRAKIDVTDGVVDGASKQLKAIRDRLRKQRERLRGTLESYLRGKETGKYLQEQVVTERNGRYVLVVKVEHRNSIPGIVHGSSSSGASLFLEPLSTVDVNNDIVASEQAEQAEVYRILLALADGLRGRALDLRTTLAAVTDIDVVQARARFSQLVEGVEPSISPDTRIEFLQARHPLLIPAVRTRLGEPRGETDAVGPTPNDVRLVPPVSTLVITGPNTGGKTVALKTAGLLALMAQAGLHIPADPGSTTTVFRTVFSDIGDEQSITASLSTFSAHIANIVEMERQLNLPALVLLDEIGAGTDPVEGGALGTAVIDHFKQRRALVIVTTHNDALKSYSATAPGVTCAGFGFDPETFAPSYRLTYGSPGRSLGLEIAARLGMNRAIIDAARQRRGTREAQLADHLARVDDDLRRLDADRRQLAQDRQQLAAAHHQLAADLRAVEDRETSLKQRLTTRVDAQVRAARAEIDTVVQDLKSKASELSRTAATRTSVGRVGLSTGETGELRAKARATVDRVAAEARTRAVSDAAPADPGPPTPSTRTSATPPQVGSRVVVGILGVEGRVLSLHDEQAEVDVRGKRLRVAIRDLRVLDEGSGGHRSTGSTSNHVTVNVRRPEGLLPDLNVIGCNVDEAQTRVEQHLDQALLREQRHLRIIHGHGTGQLRRSIAALLERHPLVDRFSLAPPDQGGGGVTLVELKE